jgi:tetratricopeptide (TPR) repeat protein
MHIKALSSLGICTLVVVGSILAPFSIHSEAEKNDQQKFEKKLLLKVFHPLLSVPSRSTLDKRLHATRDTIAKVSVDNTPVESSASSEKSKCLPEVFSKLSSDQISGIRGIQDEIFFLRGIAYELCGQLEAARDEYKSSLKLRRRNPDVLFRYAVSMLKIDRQNSVKPILEEALWRDFPQSYLVHYLIGLNLKARSNEEQALTFFEKSFSQNPTFPQSAVESYFILKSQRKNVTSPAELAALDLKLHANLGAINKLDAADREMAMEYIRHLLLSGDSLSTPHLISEGTQLAGKWIEKTGGKDDDFILMKIQFLEKSGKRDQAYSMLIERESKGELSEALKAKKLFLEEQETSDS